MYLVVGLGNPGKEYLKTLHNLGFMAVELLAEKYNLTFSKKAFKGEIAEKTINGEKVIFLKPQTFMNNSGLAIRECVNFYKIPLKNVLVFYDDLDIEIGKIRIREKGSSGTHNGMRSIVKELGSSDFPRIRIGSKAKGEIYNIIDYVLSDIKKEDEPLFKISVNKGVEAGDAFINGLSFERIMSKFNG